ncbi:MAG: ABC transporter permease [Sterolibacterium sp.]|nr:ABC transporter permease [Sterolibacterium sp.]
MRLSDSILLALRAITAQRLRSFLTLLGIAVGIAAVILLTSIGEGIHRFVLSEFSQFGTNTVFISPGKTKTGGQHTSGIPSSVRPLTIEDARALEHQPNILAVTPWLWGNSEVSGNGRVRRTTLYGVGADMPKVVTIAVRVGQFLPADDAGNARSLAVLGSKLKKELFSDANPLGARIRVGNMQFTVIGVLEPRGQVLGVDVDDTLFIPAERAMELYNRDGVAEIRVAYADKVAVESVSSTVKSVLTARHGREDFTLITQADMLKSLSKILNILTMAVGALGSISLLVGGVGIVTIMTIAVSERTSEIGLLVALGAPRRTVLGIFLGEAVVLSAIGGLFGLIIGIGLAQIVHVAIPALPVHTPFEFVALAEGIAVVIGLLAGVLPARRAAAMDAVDALRSE